MPRRRVLEPDPLSDGWRMTEAVDCEPVPALTPSIAISNYMIQQGNLSEESLGLLMRSLSLRESEYAAAALTPRTANMVNTVHYGRGGRGHRAPQIYHDAEPEDL